MVDIAGRCHWSGVVDCVFLVAVGMTDTANRLIEAAKTEALFAAAHAAMPIEAQE